MIMVHGDNKGLKLPPAVAPTQVMVVPIYKADNMYVMLIIITVLLTALSTDLDTRIKSISSRLNAVGVRLEVDSRTDKTPGWKFNHWEMKGTSFSFFFFTVLLSSFLFSFSCITGVPLRLEFGDLDVQKGQIVAVRRDNGEKTFIPLGNIESEVKRLLEVIQKNLFGKEKRKARKGKVEIENFLFIAY
jgi:prolyl-tRNA synthetase